MSRFQSIISLLCLLGCRAPSPKNLEKTTDSPAPIIESPPTALPNNVTDKMSLEGAPSARKNYVNLSIGQGILVSSGENGVNDFSDTYVFNPLNNSWKTISMPENYGNRFLAKGSFLGSETQQKAFIWGGAKFVKITKVRGQRLGDGAIIDLSKGSSSYISKSSYSPSIRDNHCLINDGKDKFIVWGGENELTHLSDGAIYSLLSGTWTAIDKSEDAGGPEGREDAACFYDSLNKRMLMYGGLSSKILSDLWSLDLETLTWRLIHLSGPSLPKLYRPTIAFSPTQVLILGRTDNASYASLIDLEAESSINLAMEEASPGQSVLEDLKAVWSPTGFMVVAKGSGADSANYLWRLEAHPTNPSSYIWEQLSPAIDSSFIGTSINITDSYIITWGGREENGALNSKGTFRAIPKAP